ASSIAAGLNQRLSREVFDGMVMVLPPPPVRGVGRVGGFAIMIEDRGDVGPNALAQHTEELARKGTADPRLGMLLSPFRGNIPQLQIDPNRRECMAQGVSLQDFTDTLQVYEGSLYVNDFNRFGRTWQVIVQAEAPFRDRPEAIPQLKVRNNRGNMVPLGSLATIRESNGPLVLARYNMYPAAPIYSQGGVAGVSTGQAISIMQELAERELPKNVSYEWTDMS